MEKTTVPIWDGEDHLGLGRLQCRSRKKKTKVPNRKRRPPHCLFGMKENTMLNLYEGHGAGLG